MSWTGRWQARTKVWEQCIKARSCRTFCTYEQLVLARCQPDRDLPGCLDTITFRAFRTWYNLDSQLEPGHLNQRVCNKVPVGYW